MTAWTPGALWDRTRRSAMVYGAMGTVVRVGANVLLLPVILETLTPAELALWWVFVALGAIANLADFGFGQSIARVYSYLQAGAEDFDTEGLRPPPTDTRPNLAKLRQLTATAEVLYRRLALGACAVLALVGGWFLWRPAIATGNAGHVWLAWAMYIGAVGYSLGTSYWLFACQGTNRMRELQASFMWSGLVYLITAAACLLAGFGLFSMVLAAALRAIVSKQMTASAYRNVVPIVPGESPKPDTSMLSRLWPNARKFGLLSLGAYLIANSGVLISSRFLGDDVTASFGLTTQIGLFLVNFSGLWLTVKWPELTMLRAQGRTREMSALFARRLLYLVITFTVLSVLVIAVGNPLLEWKGTHTQLLAAPYLLVYLLYLGQQQIYVQFGALTFTENVVPFYYVSLFTGIGLVLLSLVLTRAMGLWGLVLAPLIATMACSSWYPVWRGFRGQPLTVPQFFRAAFSGRV